MKKYIWKNRTISACLALLLLLCAYAGTALAAEPERTRSIAGDEINFMSEGLETAKSLGKNADGLSVYIVDTERYSKSFVKKTMNDVAKKFPPNLLKKCTDYFAFLGIPCYIVFRKPADPKWRLNGLTEVSVKSGIYISVFTEKDVPGVLAHELGHMLHLYLEVLMSEQGLDSFEDEWTQLNEGLNYLSGDWDYLSGLHGRMKKTFISEYAALDYYEDFAEMVRYTYMKPDTLKALIQDDAEPIAAKAAMLRRLFVTYAKVKEA